MKCKSVAENKRGWVGRWKWEKDRQSRKTGKEKERWINRYRKGMPVDWKERENTMALSSTPPKNRILLKKTIEREGWKKKSLIQVPTGLSHYHESPTTDISLYHSSRKAETLGSDVLAKGSERLLFLPLSPLPSLTGLLSNSFRKPREPAFPWNLPKWHNISRFAYAKRVKQQALAAQLTYCLLWQAELFPRNNSVTKWASCECHLGNTYLRLAEVPWQPAWRGGGKGE